VSWQKQYPPKEGWIRMDATLIAAEGPLGYDAVLKMVSFGKPEDYEIGEWSQRGRKLTIISRQKPVQKEAAV
jgi:hypothetical protein